MMTATTTPLTLPLLARMTEGDLVVREVPRDPSAREALLRRTVHGARIDSRAIQPDELFVPLRGAHADGHDFLAAAFERGAGAALCDREHYPRWAGHEPGPLVLVDDVTAALQRLAQRYREQWSGLLLGLTGSVGKTTTKELVAAALETAAPTLRTEGNLNNHWGVALTLLRLEPEHQTAVVEMAMNAAGEIAALARIARPTAALITGAGRAHLGGAGLGTPEAVAAEKASLALHVPDGAPVFANADSPALMAALRPLGRRLVTYGLGPDAEVRPSAVESLGVDGSRFEVAGFPPLRMRLVGRHQVGNALAAIAVAREYRLDPAAVAAALAAVTPLPGRMEVRSVGGATLLVDCYNANPDSTRAALATLAECPALRRIAVLGDMLELGAATAALHREAGAATRDAELWTVGAHADDTAAGGRDAGVVARVFPDPTVLVAALREVLAPGTVVLFKASRGAALERVVAALEGRD